MATARTQLSPRCCCTSRVSLVGLAWHVEFHGQRIVDGRQLVRELDVHDRTDDLNDFAFVHDELQIEVG